MQKLRGQLPPDITAAERGTGRKTHGRWVGADGVPREIVSGEDKLARVAEAVLKKFGYARLAVTSHAEMKVAVYLRQQYERTGGTPQHATIVQNQEPCWGRVGCRKMLPVMLPAGCSLTVYAPNYRRTFTGGAAR